MAAPSEAELAAARASGSGRAALGPLPKGYPSPRFRLALRDVNVRDRLPGSPCVHLLCCVSQQVVHASPHHHQPIQARGLRYAPLSYASGLQVWHACCLVHMRNGQERFRPSRMGGGQPMQR